MLKKKCIIFGGGYVFYNSPLTTWTGMLPRNKICFHPVECCCSHFPGEGWILAQCVRVSRIMGKCLGFLNVLLDIQGFVGNLYQPPALFAPAWTAQLSWRRGKKLLPSSFAAWCSLCLTSCFLHWMWMGRDLPWSQIPYGRRKDESL